MVAQPPSGSRDRLITSASNPRLKSVLGLRRRRQREDTGQTLVEGHEEIALALAAGQVPDVLFFCRELFSPSGYAGQQDIGTQEDVLSRSRAAGADVIEVSRAAFDKIAYREGPDGLLAVVAAPARTPRQLVLPTDPLVLIAQGIEKPGNLGAMLRTADAAGAAALVAADPVTDWGNPNVVRASKGTVFAVPVASGPAHDVISWARDNGLPLIVTTPATDVLHTQVDLSGPAALVVGSEKHGVDDQMLAAADQLIRIPMAGVVNSLNVSVAAAIVLYEAVRQRADAAQRHA